MSEYEYVSDIPDSKDWELITGSHERDVILNHVGIDPNEYSHGGLFVKVGNAEYEEIYFFGGNVPYLSKSVTKIY